MQNRKAYQIKREELDGIHGQLHAEELMSALLDAEPTTIEDAFIKMFENAAREQNLNLVHKVLALHAMLDRKIADFKNGEIAKKNDVRETTSKAFGMFKGPVASDSDTEVVSSVEASPVTPRM